MSKTCSVSGCDRQRRTRGLCSRHYNKKRRRGELLGHPNIIRGVPMAWLQEHVNYPGKGCLIWPFARDGDGYARIKKDGHDSPAHRVMLEIVCGPPQTDQHQAAHNCGRGPDGCVNPTHLRWATRQENWADRIGHGTDMRGEKHPLAKLSADAVREIRAGRESQSRTASRYGVSQTLVYAIRRGKAWAWLDNERGTPDE